MLISDVVFFLIPAITVLAAHFHFRSRKNPRIEIGEGEDEMASLGRRSIAYGIDFAVIELPFSFCIWRYLIKSQEPVFLGDMGSFINVLFTLSAAILLFYYIFLPVYFFVTEAIWGRSLGKTLMGIRVVMADGSRVTTKAAFIRNLCRLADLLTCHVATIVSAAATRKYQRIGDLAGKTMVVRQGGREK